MLGGGASILTPAYLSYETSFNEFRWGQGAAIAFILFVFIIVLTLLQRWILRERSPKKRGFAQRAAARNLSEGGIR